MQIDSSKDWQDTGLKPASQSGKYIVVRATGTWNCRTDDPKFGTRNAKGLYENTGAQYTVSTEGNAAFPYSGPGGLQGQLLGRIGTKGNSFVVGTYCQIEIGGSPSDTLWLRINDDNVKDNQGSLDVTWLASDGPDTSAPAKAPYIRTGFNRG